MATNNIIPKKVFIVPYRNRIQHKFFFSNYMTNTILAGDNDYEIYFSHQCDARSFNRGATKNIGFLAIKQKYPNHYKDITFIFNDVDTMPFDKIFTYDTVHGIVKHYYGFEYALGGIVAIKGADFEATNGYPNFWGWGMEDNVLQKRCERIGLIIDRTEFFKIGSPEILQLFDGVARLINRKDPWRAEHDNNVDGLRTIHNLAFTIDAESTNPLDNVHTVNSNKIQIINISTFMTGVRFEHDNYYQYDIREPPRKVIHPDRVPTKKINVTTDDWSHIPYYPTLEEKKQIVSQYGQQKAEQMIQNTYNNSNTNTNIATQLPIPPSHINVNKYAPEYARLIGHKPKATKSANIGLGGVKYK